MNNHLSQGSIFSSLRSMKYVNQHCFGVIISASCDIANEKIYKIYYLEALPLEDWIISNDGLNMIAKEKISSLINLLKKYALHWETIKSFSVHDFEQVIRKELTSSKEINNAIGWFKDYIHYLDPLISFDQRKSIIKANENIIRKQVENISNGKHSHYVYIPNTAFDNDFQNGLIVDLQEVDYLEIEIAKDLLNCEIDTLNTDLNTDRKARYNKKFYIDEEPGYAMVVCNLKSPWIEYLMQHFSNAFTRIGIDNPPKSEIKDMIKKIIE